MGADPAGGLTGRGDTRREEEAALNPVTAGESLQRCLVTLRLDFLHCLVCVCLCQGQVTQTFRVRGGGSLGQFSLHNAVDWKSAAESYQNTENFFSCV